MIWNERSLAICLFLMLICGVQSLLTDRISRIFHSLRPPCPSTDSGHSFRLLPPVSPIFIHCILDCGFYESKSNSPGICFWSPVLYFVANRRHTIFSTGWFWRNQFYHQYTRYIRALPAISIQFSNSVRSRAANEEVCFFFRYLAIYIICCLSSSDIQDITLSHYPLSMFLFFIPVFIVFRYDI